VTLIYALNVLSRWMIIFNACWCWLYSQNRLISTNNRCAKRVSFSLVAKFTKHWNWGFRVPTLTQITDGGEDWTSIKLLWIFTNMFYSVITWKWYQLLFTFHIWWWYIPTFIYRVKLLIAIGWMFLPMYFIGFIFIRRTKIPKKLWGC
jgi:hypothetical protein